MTKRNDKFTREARRVDAEKRQAEYAKLSVEEKTDRAKGRRGSSTRELSRLGKQDG